MQFFSVFSSLLARIQARHIVTAGLFSFLMPHFLIPSVLCAQGWNDQYGGEYGPNGKTETTAIKIGSLDLTSLFATPIDPALQDDRPLLKQQVEHAFRTGRMATAMELFFGHLVVNYDAASADLDSVKYSPVLKRPVWQTRWAVSLAVRGDQVTSKSPILEDKGAMNSRAYSMDYGSGFDEMDSNGYQADTPDGAAATEMLSSNADEILQESLGLVATVTAEQFTQRFSDGFFGPALASIIPKPVVESPNADTVDGAADPTNGRSMGNGRTRAGQPGRDRHMDDRMGRPRDSMEEYGLDEYGEDEYGLDEYGLDEYGHDEYGHDELGQQGAGQSDQNETSLKADPRLFELAGGIEPFPMWQPGLVFLGEMSSAEAIEMAQKNKIDFLLHFDVMLKDIRNPRNPNADGYTQNISRCRLIRGDDGKTITISKPMDNLELARQKRTSREYIDEQMGNLFTVIDRQLALLDMPSLSPEIVTRRVTALMAGRDAKNLETMAEIRYYQLKGLLSQEDAEKAFYLLGSDDGLKMLYATEEDKLEVIHKWVEDAMAPK